MDALDSHGISSRSRARFGRHVIDRVCTDQQQGHRRHRQISVGDAGRTLSALLQPLPVLASLLVVDFGIEQATYAREYWPARWAGIFLLLRS